MSVLVGGSRGRVYFLRSEDPGRSSAEISSPHILLVHLHPLLRPGNSIPHPLLPSHLLRASTIAVRIRAQRSADPLPHLISRRDDNTRHYPCLNPVRVNGDPPLQTRGSCVAGSCFLGSAGCAGGNGRGTSMLRRASDEGTRGCWRVRDREAESGGQGCAAGT